jgi:glucosamine-phosphate N-acetyltransferase
MRQSASNELSVRPLTALDIGPSFIELLAQLSPTVLKPDQANEVFRQRLTKGWQTFVAYQDEHLVGTASLLVERKFIHNGGALAHIEDVVVRADYRGQDIGSKLLAHCEQEARRAGCYRMVLHCTQAAQGFYERHNFVAHGLEMRCELH